MENLRTIGSSNSSAPDEESCSNVMRLACLPKCRADKAPTETRCPDQSPPEDGTVQGYHKLRKSSPPSRIFFFENDEWVEFPKPVLDELTAGFAGGKLVFVLSDDGNTYLIDFLRMVRIDLSTEARSSIAWIDAKDNCFFPEKTESEILKDIGKVKSLGSSGQLRSQGGKVDKDCKMVETMFLNGMRKLAPNTVVTSVNKCPRSDLSRSSGLKGFKMMLDMTREARGDANLKFGWYGASPEDFDAIVNHGFGKPNSDRLGFKGHGHGVHLSTQHAPYASSCLSRADFNGEKHIILCRIIMGKSERVEAGSVQSHPSNEDFDSGVDNLENPKWYIVWSTHMNTHILPQYVVSFKSFNKPQGLMRAVTSARRRRGPETLQFEYLLSGLSTSLPSSRIRALEMLYDDYKAGRIKSPAFMRHLRSLVGDGLLISTIKRIR